MKHLVLLLLGLLAAAPTHAQIPASTPRHNTLLDVSGAVGRQRGYGSAAAWRLWGLPVAATTDRFQLGLGIRATVFWLPTESYASQTAPPDHRLVVMAASQTALNAALHLRARVAGPVRVGFNIDLAGITLGAGPDSQQFAAAGGKVSMGSAEPVRGNLLLGGRRDRGSLNSDFYISTDVSPAFGAHVGFSHIVNAYELNQQRFRRFANLASAGLTYRLNR